MNIEDTTYILKTFDLAKKGMYHAAPNPLVGAVLVKEDKVIGRGFHQKYGGPHAEVEAILNAKESVDGATLYCNLEPCCHTNKQTPPCTSLLIEKKIKKVVISNLDPNPEVSGRGVELLKSQGIEVETGVCELEGERLNEVFFTYMRKKRPFIHVKVAQTLDGKICTNSGDSKWISSESCRREVHHHRRIYQAIAVGRQTLERDNPSLTARDENGDVLFAPLRVIFGKKEKVSKDLAIFKDGYENFFTQSRSIREVMDELYKRKITSLYVEGGQSLVSSLINADVADRLSVYIKPTLIGNGKSFYLDENKLKIKDGIKLIDSSWRMVDDLIVYEGRL